MSLITILIGISGAGKSTLSKTFPNAVRLNRDDTRKMLFGVEQSDTSYYLRKDIKSCEELVTETLEDTMYNLLNKGRDIIFDNTNLTKAIISDIIFKFNHLANIELKFLDISLDEAKQRVMLRNGLSDTSSLTYIDKQFNQLATLKKQLAGERLFYPMVDTKLKFDENLPPTYIVDIDGTVALKGDRNIFDESKVHLDIEIKEVSNVVKALSASGFKIVYVSGRNDSSMIETVNWLKSKNLWMSDSEIFMRKSKDNRNDAIVKEEIVLNNLIPNFNVIGVIDDRLGVTRNFHKLGMFVLNVNQGFKKF